MACLNKMRSTGCELKCHCKNMMLTLISNALNTIFLTFNILFNQSSLFKALQKSRFYCMLQSICIFEFKNTSAATSINWFDYNWKRQTKSRQICIYIYLNTLRTRIAICLKCKSHQMLISALFSTFGAITRQIKLICNIIYSNIPKISRNATDTTNTNLTAFFSNSFHLSNTDWIEKISSRFPNVISGPGKYVSYITKLFCFFN
ncbi:hypothetical protein IMSAGC012_03012 [Lachnospiraceae bacterium]|nr:hypothetical protein IMSAGC012_03012 [Lachnospiraceae bacterium]